MKLRSRSGVALLLAILLLVVLECIVLGVLEMARQQRRIAANRVRLLAVQLQAEGAGRRALVEWPPQLTTAGLTVTRESGGVTLRQTYEPLPGDLVLVDAAAAAPPPARIRHRSSLLARPPLLAPEADPDAAALTASTAIVSATALLTSGPSNECGAPQGAALRTAQAPAIDPAATVDGPIELRSLESQSPLTLLDRAAADPGLLAAVGDTVLSDARAGLLLARGSISFAAGAAFRGLVIGGADLHIDDTAIVVGAIWVAGSATVSGTLIRDPCEVAAVIRAAGLRRARAVAGRAWLPGF